MALPIKSLFYYDTPTTELLLTVTSGKVYKWDTNTWSEITGWTPVNSDARVEIEQGVDKCLLTDGVGNMQSYNGTSFTDLGATSNDPPKGCSILRWHTQRMFAAGHPTLTDTIWVSNILDFGSGQWNTTTRSFRIGGGDGDPIIGLFSMPGIQPPQNFTLAVMKESSVWLTNTDPTLPPSNWSANQPVASLTKGIGLCGKHAACAWGNDLFFVARDRQIYSLQRMVSATGQYQVSPPMSQPMQPIIDRINPNSQTLIEVLKYRELILFCVPLDTSTYNNTTMVYNARLQRWMGYWTGWSPTAITISRFSGTERLVIGDEFGFVNQWKDYTSVTADSTYKDNNLGYATEVDTRSTRFGENLNRKEGKNMKIAFSAGNAEVNIKAVQDLLGSRSISSKVQPSGDILGIGILGSFKLSSQSPVIIPRGLKHLNRFTEMYLRIRSETGWFHLRSVSLAAFLCSFKDNK